METTTWSFRARGEQLSLSDPRILTPLPTPLQQAPLTVNMLKQSFGNKFGFGGRMVAFFGGGVGRSRLETCCIDVGGQYECFLHVLLN